MRLWKTLIRNLTAGPATRLFPAVPLTAVPGVRGDLRLLVERCTFCRACAVRCPAQALEVDKPGQTWTLDPFRCIYCHYCVEVCPYHALTMDPLGPSPAGAKKRVHHTAGEAVPHRMEAPMPPTSPAGPGP